MRMTMHRRQESPETESGGERRLQASAPQAARSPESLRNGKGANLPHEYQRRVPILTACAIFFSLGLAAPCAAQSAQTIIQRSTEANRADWKATPNYDFRELDRGPGGHTRTHEVTMILGSPYERLIGVDGKPLSPQQKAGEERKLQEAIQARQHESAEERAKRIASYEKSRSRNHLLIDQLTLAFDFELLGEQQLGPYNVYVLKATPRPGYKPPNREAEVLTGMQGELWIDEKTFQWVKVEAQVIHPVSIEGFLATVERGTRFELEKMPVANDIWLPKHFSMRARAKILFFFSHNQQEDQTYFDYRLRNRDQEAQPH
jgi:hypothetical protein